MAAGQIGCASSPSSNDVPSDITEATGDVTTPENGAPPPADKSAPANTAAGGETSEQDLQNNPMADSGQPPPATVVPPAPVAPPGVAPLAAAPPDATIPAPETSANSLAETPPPPAPEKEVAPPPSETGEPVTLTGLDFKGNVNGGTIVIRTSKPAQFTTLKKR